MSYSSPGRAYREGISLLELADMFPDEEAAVKWFEKWLWPDGQITCLRCGGCDAYRVRNGKPMPYRCRSCKRYFSLKTNTAMEASNLPLRKWAYAIYLEVTSLKGVSSLKLRRDLKIAQSSAWFMLHRIVQVRYSPDTRPRRGQFYAAVLTSFPVAGFRARRFRGIPALKTS